MPVISPRRSSATSSSFYVMPTSSSASSAELSATNSYLDRGNSQSKSSPTSYNSTYGVLNSYSYTPRTSSTYRPLGSSTSATSYLSGGYSKYSSYRSPSTYLSSNNDSTLSNRYGLKTKSNKPPIKKDPIRTHDGLQHETSNNKSSNSGSDCSKSNNNRLSSSYSSSSSLARFVATSGLELYEKYSPAHYIPKCELLRSRNSISEAKASPSAADNKITDDLIKKDTTKANTRYSHLNTSESIDDNNNSNDDVAIVSAIISKRTSSKPIDKLLHSSSSSSSVKCSFNNNNTNSRTSTVANSSSNINKSPSDDAIPTYTIYSNRLRRSAVASTNATNDDDDDENALKNGSTAEKNSYSNSNNSTDRVTATRNHLKDLNLSSASSLLGAASDCKEGAPTATATVNIANCSNGSDAITPAVSKSMEAITISPSIGSNGSKARSSSVLRSALAPPSPTSTRYPNISRTSALSSYDSPYTNTSQTSSEKSEGLCGLRNIGNTCFMNSVIQCLSHTSELTRFLRSLSGAKSASTKDQQILYEFAKLIREMWTANVNSVTPLELKRAFSSKHRMYSDYNQQDAQEFLRFFLDSLHSALNTGIKGGDHLKIDDNLNDNKKADLTWEWYTRHENSLIRDLFVGQLKSTLKCTTCGNTSVTFDPFWDLSVSLPSSSRCKLDTCLDLFIREEILDGDEMPTCARCRTRRRCTKSFSIQRFPKYLVIHLKRFSETRWSKLSNIVEFPTGERELNMGPYGSNHSSNAYYSLYGISNHMGSTAGGHYVALCKHPLSKKWHEFNDNIVSDDLSESHLVSSSAYILFYERA